MSWSAITAAILKERKVAPLIDAAKNYAAALTPPQADPTAAIIASAIADIRANVASCPRNQLDADTSKIPGDLVDLACRMIIRSLKNFVEIDLTQDERDQAGRDERRLERIARCELAVEATTNPETTATVDVPSGTPRINEPTPRFNRTSQDGI